MRTDTGTGGGAAPGTSTHAEAIAKVHRQAHAQDGTKSASKKVAFVTGTSSGFGLLTSVALAREGYHVVASMRDLQRKGRLEKAAQKAGVADRLEIVQLDVTDFSAVEKVVGDVLVRHGQIDVLVNNAGYAAGGFIEDLSIDEWRRQFETNFFGVVAVTKAVLPAMRQRRRGLIINISSISGQIGMPALGPYTASKFALEGYSESLRLEMLPFGVHVALIEPGSFKTDIWSKGLQAFQTKADSPYAERIRMIAKYVERVAERAPEPDSVIETIVQVVRSPYPNLRYPVGKGVKNQMFLKRVLPWKWIERTVAKQFRFLHEAKEGD